MGESGLSYWVVASSWNLRPQKLERVHLRGCELPVLIYNFEKEVQRV